MATRAFAAFGVLLILYLIPNSEIVEAELCESESQTYSGKCENKECDKKCREWEKQEHGACHVVEGKNNCFCYSECNNTSPEKDKKPAPPDALKPPPTDGGSSPPSGEGGGGEGGGGGGGGGEGGDGGPEGGSNPSPPPGCQGAYVENLINQALENYKAQFE